MAEEKSAQLGISLPRYDGPLTLLLTLIRRREYGGPGIPRNALAAAWFAITGRGPAELWRPSTCCSGAPERLSRYSEPLGPAGRCAKESSAAWFSCGLRSLNAAIYRGEAAC